MADAVLQLRVNSLKGVNVFTMRDALPPSINILPQNLIFFMRLWQ